LFQNLKELKGGHLRGQIAQNGLSFVAFGMLEKKNVFEKTADILAFLERNEWMGKREIQLRIKDAQPS